MWQKILSGAGLGRPEQRAWAMYDWANSGYVTVVTAAVLPPLFAGYYAADLPPARATMFYALGVSCALLLAAVASPIVGALADYRMAKKRYLGIAVLAGAAAIGLLFGVPKGGWLPAVFLVMLGNIAFSLSIVFYESLLPSIAREDEVDRVSAAGYALGYVGGGLLLAINTLWILFPGTFGMADASHASRWSILSAAVWWIVFSTPLFRKVKEPRVEFGPDRPALAAAFVQLVRTLRDLVGYRDLFVFLLAFWLYNDGIGTIIRMATIYGREVGIEVSDLILALLVTQFVAFPCSILFGQIGSRVGPKKGIYLALCVYALIAVLGYFMQTAIHFYALAILVGTVQGGAQALSRSLFTRMVPKNRTGEFFGFFSVSSRFAAVLGPALFALVNYLTGTSRLAILMIVVFFVGGGILLGFVNVERGAIHARSVERSDTGA